jgi:hypothetical protein
MLALLLAVATTVTFPAPGTYAYAASLGGQPVGQWSVTVKSGDSGSEIDENSAATFGGMQLSARAALVLGADLSPQRYEGHYQTPGQSPNVSVVLTPTSAIVVGAFTSQPTQVALASNTRHFVVVEPGLLAGLFALPAQLGAWKDPSVTWITPTSGRAQPLTVNQAALQKPPAGVPAQDALISIDSPIALTIWYDSATLVPDRIEVPSQSAVLTRVR